MGARKHHFNNCPHFGYGAYCHRCRQAEVLLATIKGKSAEDPRLQEAQRLRAGKQR